MKKFFKEFLFRGLIAASGGPVVLAIIYGILGATNTVKAISTNEACLGILTITLLAFVVAGMTAIYQMEQLPLVSAILIHAAALYVAYLVIYLINGWLKHQLTAFLGFTAIFVVLYALIWLFIYIATKIKTERINKRLKENL